MTISLGIHDFITRYIPDCSIKWPNDIYVNDDKIAGILIESSVSGNQIESTVAGIGLNINQTKFKSDAPNPISLSMLTGINFDLITCLNQLSADIDNRYKQLIAGNSEEIIKEYISRLYRLNKWHEFRDSKEIFSGRILTIGGYGRIKIEKLNGVICVYSFKEIEFIL